MIGFLLSIVIIGFVCYVLMKVYAKPIKSGIDSGVTGIFEKTKEKIGAIIKQADDRGEDE